MNSTVPPGARILAIPRRRNSGTEDVLEHLERRREVDLKNSPSQLLDRHRPHQIRARDRSRGSGFGSTPTTRKNTRARRPLPKKNYRNPIDVRERPRSLRRERPIDVLYEGSPRPEHLNATNLLGFPVEPRAPEPHRRRGAVVHVPGVRASGRGDWYGFGTRRTDSI